MRLASFVRGGRAGFGLVKDSGVVDLSSRLAFPDLTSLLAAAPARGMLESLAQNPPDLPLDEVRWLPVIPNPDKVLCVGINYRAHREEMGRSEAPHPTLFTRFTNTLIGQGEALVKPRASTEFDYEAELAVIIGKRGRHVPRQKALDLVAGYSCFNDATARDWQRHTTQFTAGKNFVASGALGPWLVTADEIPDPASLTVSLRLNGQELQRASTEELIFDVPALIEYITTFTELVPGDVIATGTPSGVGSKRKPPIFLQPGDTVEVEVDRVGCLRNRVAAEP